MILQFFIYIIYCRLLVNKYSNNYIAGGRCAGLNKREKMTNFKKNKISSIPLTKIGVFFCLLFQVQALSRLTFDIGSISIIYCILLAAFFMLTCYCERSQKESYLTKVNNMRESLLDRLVFIPVLFLAFLVFYTAYSVASNQDSVFKYIAAFVFYFSAAWCLIYHMPTRSYVDQTESSKDNDGVFRNAVAITWRRMLKGKWYTYIAQLICISTILFFIPFAMMQGKSAGISGDVINSSVVYISISLLFLTLSRHLTEGYRGMITLMVIVVLLSPVAAHDALNIGSSLGFLALFVGCATVYLAAHLALVWISSSAYRGVNNVLVSTSTTFSYFFMIAAFLFGTYSATMQSYSSIINEIDDIPTLQSIAEKMDERTYLSFDGYKPELRVLNVKDLVLEKLNDGFAESGNESAGTLDAGEVNSPNLLSLDSAIVTAVKNLNDLGYAVTREDLALKLKDVKFFTPLIYQKITQLEKISSNGLLTAVASEQGEKNEVIEQSKGYVFVQMARVTKPTFELILPAFKWYFESKKSESPDAIKLVEFAVQRDAVSFWNTYESIYNQGKVTLETESFASRINELDGMGMPDNRAVPFPEFRLLQVPRVNSFSSMSGQDGDQVKVGEEMIDAKRLDLIFNDIECKVLADQILNK